MRNKLLIAITLFIFPFTLAYAKSLDDNIQNALNSHYNTYKDKENFSGIALSVYIPNQPIKNYYIGKMSHDKNSKNIDASTLFNIGSITKSFTAAILLQLEQEKKLKLSDTVEQLLPQYNKWSGITITSLLNMTSGLPNYTASPIMNVEEYKNMERQWTDSELIQLVYPPKNFIPPLKSGYNYTNTGYILAAMVIEKVTHHSLKNEMETRLFIPAGLKNTFYPVPALSKKITARLADGYAYNSYDNPEILGKNMKMNNLSWAGGAGAVISNSEDIIKWVKALFVDNNILNATQKNSLTQLVSMKTGEPIKELSSDDSRGFGLGVVGGTDKKIGKFWFYEGETMGYRACYLYSPDTGIIIATIMNSAVDSDNDHIHDLLMNVYGVVSKPN